MLSLSANSSPYLLSSSGSFTGMSNSFTTPTPTSLIQSTIPTANQNSIICSDLNKKIDELIASLKQNECDELAKMNCAINRNTERLEDLACAVGGGCNDLKLELIKYEKLYEKVFMAIDTYLVYFREGDFESLTDEMTEDFFVEIGQALVTDELFEPECGESLKCYVHDKLMFSKYKSNVHKILDGLNKGISLYNQKEECCKRAEELNEILTDQDKLTEYIKQKLASVGLFDINVQAKVLPGLNPKVQRYIDKYGFEKGMVFESEKMAEVIRELIEEGIMSETDLDTFLETCNDTNNNNTSQCDNPDTNNDCNNNLCDLPEELPCDSTIITKNIILDTSSDDESVHGIKLEIESIHSSIDISGNEGDIDDTLSEYTTDSEFELESITNE